MSIKEKSLLIKHEPSGRQWLVPIIQIAKNRAEHYKGEFGDDLERSLNEDTWPLFESDKYEIKDWLANNMDADDLNPIEVKGDKPSYTFQDAFDDTDPGDMEFVNPSDYEPISTNVDGCKKCMGEAE